MCSYVNVFVYVHVESINIFFSFLKFTKNIITYFLATPKDFHKLFKRNFCFQFVTNFKCLKNVSNENRF
jgi:hypothetical protein